VPPPPSLSLGAGGGSDAPGSAGAAEAAGGHGGSGGGDGGSGAARRAAHEAVLERRAMLGATLTTFGPAAVEGGFHFTSDAAKAKVCARSVSMRLAVESTVGKLPCAGVLPTLPTPLLPLFFLPVRYPHPALPLIIVLAVCCCCLPGGRDHGGAAAGGGSAAAGGGGATPPPGGRRSRGRANAGS